MRSFGAVVAIAACMAGAGCSDSRGPPEAEANAAGGNETAAAPPAAVYPDHYRDIRAAAADAGLPDHGAPGLAEGPIPGRTEAPRYFEVIDCNEGARSVEVAEPDETDAALFALAQRVVLLERALKRDGYSDAVAQSLRDYEQRELARLIEGRAPAPGDFSEAARGFAEDPEGRELYRFAEAAEARRARLQPDAPPILAEGGCGAGETPYFIRTLPANGRAWLITEFYFQLCRRRGLDPWNREDCSGWGETIPTEERYLAGRYRYQARWPDGARGSGMRLLNPFDHDVGEPVTLELRPD